MAEQQRRPLDERELDEEVREPEGAERDDRRRRSFREVDARSREQERTEDEDRADERRDDEEDEISKQAADVIGVGGRRHQQSEPRVIDELEEERTVVGDRREVEREACEDVRLAAPARGPEEIGVRTFGAQPGEPPDRERGVEAEVERLVERKAQGRRASMGAGDEKRDAGEVVAGERRARNEDGNPDPLLE